MFATFGLKRHGGVGMRLGLMMKRHGRISMRLGLGWHDFS
jgi:hypothetical protein